MSSSQTMTAPAVGHRPPDAAPDMSSVYDYPRSQQQHQHQQQHLDPQPHSSPPNDSAIRALQDPVPDPLDASSPNGLPALSSATIKSEPDDQSSVSPAPHDSQSDLRRQSAASALLAQLLGNQSSSGPSPSEDHPMPPAPQATDQPHQVDDKSNLQWTLDSTSEPMATAPADSTGGGADQVPPTSTAQPSSHHQQDEKFDPQPDMALTNPEEDTNPTVKMNDSIDGLTDPLLFVKGGIDHADLFTPFDLSSSSKNPFDALQHNEMLTDAYLSQSADLSALGYSGVPHDGSGSVTGSEPRIQAFAKLEFDDGHFYCNTYSFILGRDVRAARAAHQREIQVRQAMRTTRAKSSSGGNMSHTPVRVKHEGSGMMGSVVSDRGGIMGFDPDVSHLPRLSRRSSVSSHAESGAPLHATPAQLQSTDNNTTDYNALAMQSLNEENGDAKPVDALALLPSPDACPTIPIHPPATVDGSAAGHRGISRKHVKIAYNFDKNLFEMEVMGRNGAFIGADWLSPGQIRPLHSGDYIQIGGVRIRFLLPDVPIGETGADRVEEPLGTGEETSQTPAPAVEDEVEMQRGPSESADNKDAPRPPTKLILKTREPDSARPMPSVEGVIDPALQPIRRRGPGRPPKDGIMSKRERAELAREQKLAAKREANGGVTPPPGSRPKAGKAPASTTATVTPKEMGGESPGSKPEKRKYTKRKKPDGTPMDFPLPSTEGGQYHMEHRPEEFIKAPPVKKRKPSRSPSPNYPPESAYTPEDLAKPPYNYAVLIFDALTEAGTPMTLKQIYRALKLKYPYFRFKCETEGWTSSVRHNLNGNSHLFMHAERDGKGWSWQLRPGASVEKEKKRRPSPPPPAAQPPPPAPPSYMPALNPSYGTQPNGQPSMANAHFQFPAMPSNPYATHTHTHAPAPAPSPAPPAPHHASPYPPPPQPAASTPFPIPSPLRNNLPPAFAQTTPSTYTSPYASDPPPQLVQLQQQQSQSMPPQPQHQSPYPPPNPPPMPPSNAPHPAHQTHQTHPPPPPPPGPPPGPPMQHQPNMGMVPGPGPAHMDSSDASSFNDRANKAIDDFEAVLMEDYEDKNYIREVLKSARARVLGNATDSSFPGGEPKDEEVIVDALRNLIGSLKGE